MRFSLTCFALAVRFLCAFSIICSLDGYCRHVVDVRVEPIHHCNFRQFHFCFSTSMLLIALALALSLLCVCVCVSLVTIEIKSPQHSVVGFAFFSQCKLMSCGQCFEFLHGTDLFSVVHQTVHQVILNQIKKNPQQQQWNEWAWMGQKSDVNWDRKDSTEWKKSTTFGEEEKGKKIIWMSQQEAYEREVPIIQLFSLVLCWQLLVVVIFFFLFFLSFFYSVLYTQAGSSLFPMHTLESLKILLLLLLILRRCFSLSRSYSFFFWFFSDFSIHFHYSNYIITRVSICWQRKCV